MGERSEAKKRESLFTVRDAEAAVVTYTLLGFLYILGILVYKWVTGWDGVVPTLVFLDTNYPRFNRVAIAWIIFREGGDIMLRRYSEWRAEHSHTVAKAKAAGIAEGVEQGKVAERQRWEAWYQRLQDAVTRGEPFNEPPPSQNGASRSDPKDS